MFSVQCSAFRGISGWVRSWTLNTRISRGVEAKINVEVNNLHRRITIQNICLEKLEQTYSLILANLRLPTLKELKNTISSLSTVGGIAILSGIRISELNRLIELYSHHGWRNKFWKSENYSRLDSKRLSSLFFLNIFNY